MKMSRVFFSTLVGIFVLLMYPHGSLGWFSDPKINSPVASKAKNQIDQVAVPDGAGGTIIAWSEQADGGENEFDVYAQRIDAHGEPQWPSPIPICTESDYQGFPQIISDGVGGAIIVWHDSRGGMNETYSNFDLYAQRVDGSGQILWDLNGVPVSTTPEYAVFPHIIPDGMGGAIISWDDGRSGNSQDYVQRVNQEGQPIWQQDGVLVADRPDGQSDVFIIPDGFGGAIAVWDDYRSNETMDIYAQRFDEDGNRLWGAEGLAVCTLVGNQFGPRLASDGVGGTIIAWTDERSEEGNLDVFAQRIDAAGNIMWSSGGLPIAELSGGQRLDAVISDGVGGAIMAWVDGRKENGDSDIYAQRISSQGVALWGEGGLPVASTEQPQIYSALVSDGASGAFFTWMDFARGGSSWNIYAQRIDESGTEMWQKDGIPVSIADETQSNPFIIQDGSDGVIILWYDARHGTYFNVYAQQVDRRGILGGDEFRFYTVDLNGMPKTTFAPGELITFKSSWTSLVSAAPGTYEAQAAMVINSSTDFRYKSVTYDVSD